MGTKNKRNDQKPIQISNAFRQAVEATAEIADGYCQGLQALRANATTVTAENTLHLEGSVDIDACVHNLYPNDSRWDYAIGYEGKSYFLEVHPANTSNVSEMLNKAKWLKGWLQDKALPLKNIAAGKTLYWVPSGKCKILPGSPESKRLAQSHIRIVKPLRLPIK